MSRFSLSSPPPLLLLLLLFYAAALAADATAAKTAHTCSGPVATALRVRLLAPLLCIHIAATPSVSPGTTVSSVSTCETEPPPGPLCAADYVPVLTAASNRRVSFLLETDDFDRDDEAYR